MTTTRHGSDLDRPSAGPAGPLGSGDPRFADAPERAERALVPSKGPGVSPHDERVRRLRTLIRTVFVAGIVVFVVVLVVALRGDSTSLVEVGALEAVREAVSERPHRVCREEDGFVCAWLTLSGGELYALSTSGPLRSEFGRQGVGWCPSSGRFGSNSTGSRYDAQGRLLEGSSPRGLDRFRVTVDGGVVSVDFGTRTTGIQASRSFEPVPALGPACEEIPFDRDADLELGPAGGRSS